MNFNFENFIVGDEKEALLRNALHNYECCCYILNYLRENGESRAKDIASASWGTDGYWYTTQKICAMMRKLINMGLISRREIVTNNIVATKDCRKTIIVDGVKYFADPHDDRGYEKAPIYEKYTLFSLIA